MIEDEEKEKLDLRIVLFIGIMFSSTILAWEMYDSQVPITLYQYLGSLALVGLIMGLDNLIGLILQPIMGNISDNTRSRYGRRIPYLIIGVPLAAFFFALIAFETSLFTLLFFVFCWCACFSHKFHLLILALLPCPCNPAIFL